MLRMPRRSKKPRASPVRPPDTEHDPYLEHWRELAPFERLRRSWNLRKLLRNPQAVHDAKTLPEL